MCARRRRKDRDGDLRVRRGEPVLRDPTAGVRVPGQRGARCRPVRECLSRRRLLGPVVVRGHDRVLDLLVLGRGRADGAGRRIGGLVLAAGPSVQRRCSAGRRAAGEQVLDPDRHADVVADLLALVVAELLTEPLSDGHAVERRWVVRELADGQSES
jgi:hypothetical protein